MAKQFSYNRDILKKETNNQLRITRTTNRFSNHRRNK